MQVRTSQNSTENGAVTCAAASPMHTTIVPISFAVKFSERARSCVCYVAQYSANTYTHTEALCSADEYREACIRARQVFVRAGKFCLGAKLVFEILPGRSPRVKPLVENPDKD